jgi:hypothetical protein
MRSQKPRETCFRVCSWRLWKPSHDRQSHRKLTEGWCTIVLSFEWLHWRKSTTWKV